MKLKATHAVVIPEFDLSFRAGEIKDVEEDVGKALLSTGCFTATKEKTEVKVKKSEVKATSFDKQAIEAFKSKKIGEGEEK